MKDTTHMEWVKCVGTWHAMNYASHLQLLSVVKVKYLKDERAKVPLSAKNDLR